MKMDRKYWLNTVIICFLMMIIIIQIPMHVYADEKRQLQSEQMQNMLHLRYLDSNGDLTGLNIDLMDAIAEEAGFEVKFGRSSRLIHCLDLLEAGDIEAIAASIHLRKKEQRA